jgi:chromosome transmission fidelity protein 1
MKHTFIGKDEVITSSCEYFTPHYLRLFSDHVHSQIRDIEDIVLLGKSLRSCAYYGSRGSVGSAELVVLPYQMLLHKPTRESLGIDIEGNIVVIDEAHNLIDTITQIYTVPLTVLKISQAHAQLSQYKDRYLDRLHPNNRQYIEKILYILSHLLKFMKLDTDANQPETEILTMNDFLYRTNFDNLNLFKIDKYLQNSDIIRKVNSFCTDFNVEIKTKNTKNNEIEENLVINVLASEFNKHRPALGTISAFFQSLLIMIMMVLFPLNVILLALKNHP